DRDGAIDWLLESDEPAIRYRTRTWVLGQAETNPAVRRERKQVPDGQIISTLLDFPSVATVDPYRKWFGLHWRLVSLADFRVHVDREAVRKALDNGIDRELDWIAKPHNLESHPKLKNGLYLSHASMEGNALYAASRFGHARDERARALAAQLLEWQWPGGGWNCDRSASGRRSSFHESWATAIGLAAYHKATGDADALAAAGRTGELLLEHRLFRTLRDGEPIHPSFVALHWPAYWHYDLLAGLRMLHAVDPKLLRDPRAADALDLLESKRLPNGRFQADRTWWQRPSNPTSPVDVVDWGKGRPSEVLTLHALAVLKA